MSWSLDGRPLRRVLVTRLRYLGDVAMSTVVTGALRRGDPALEVGFLCEEPYAPLLAGQPDLARVHRLRVRRRGADARARATGPAVRDGDRAAPAAGTLALAAQLRRARYDLAVDLFFNPRSAWLLWLAGIPRRIGGAAGGRRRLYTHVAPAPPPAAGPGFAARAAGGLGDHLARLAPLRHVETGLDFPAWLEAACAPGDLRPRVARPRAWPAAAGEQLAGADFAAGYLVLAPAATWPTKEWPAGHWRDLARRLLDAQPRPVWALAPPDGAGPHAGLAAEIPAGRGGLLPPLGLADALAVVGGASGVVAADGGIMHAAVAMGVPTLALFGPTDPAIWFPYEGLGPFRVLATRPPCAPCHRHACDAFVCLPDLAPSTVARAAGELFARGEAT